MAVDLESAAKTASNIKILAAFVTAVLIALITATILVYDALASVKTAYAEFEALKTDVAALKTATFVDSTDLATAFRSERQQLLTSANSQTETVVTGGQQGWNAPITCPPGQYAAGIQFEGANQGVENCITCFLRAKVICRQFPAP